MEEAAVKELVSAWHKKVKEEQDPYFRFFTLWLCINAWLQYESCKGSDHQMLKWLKHELSSSVLGRSYLAIGQMEGGRRALEEFAELTRQRPIHSTRAQPGGRLEAPIQVGTWDDHEQLIEGIYRVRCNLFHGGKRPDADRDMILVAKASAILDLWLRTLICKWRRS